MMWAILSVMIVLSFIGIGAIDRVQSLNVPAASSQPAALATGQDFMIYRNAVLAYAEENASVGTGGNANVLPQFLVLPAGVAVSNLPAGIGNLITPGPNGSRIVYTWAPAPTGTVAETVMQFGGDVSIGRAEGTVWDTPAYGTMGTLPAGIPSGDMISVVQLGG
ncbi:type IV pilus biogenesis protein PilM [Acidocella aminolytica]|uniref:Uncharacterized protein n=1 Tax=Acidocella aminolytica 101 = DSM 11237 TaxID=1120923 RepID=A0A0D6PF59_9PROT|nr:type IV pilus biogenesis protein PilM [Acidocella aminolytica]GAN80385.1 hypothetical protein Aam_046_026 [Acidocella aminolytica 101 = DSM 11237]GBQ34818.1 hypothetical protein AA11237_0830 [Acidocella aminolytica 101 = DSM 11237]SHF44566.1 PilM protein [Acidocella aminolytica 101 = DSM 11237]